MHCMSQPNSSYMNHIGEDGSSALASHSWGPQCRSTRRLLTTPCSSWKTCSTIPVFQICLEFVEAPLDVIGAALTEGGRFAEEVLLPLNRSGDKEGCRRASDGAVATPKGFKEAYKAYSEGGWISVSGDPEYSGQGMPFFLSIALSEYVISANLAFGMYPGLTNGAAAALAVHGSEELKGKFLSKMTTGEWTGTINLTEPHCGTDLGQLKTRADPQR